MTEVLLHLRLLRVVLRHAALDGRVIASSGRCADCVQAALPQVGGERSGWSANRAPEIARYSSGSAVRSA